MRKQRMLILASAAAAAVSVLSSAPTSYGLIVGDFEGGSLDNWAPANAFNIEPVQGIGNTSGLWALKVDVPQSFNPAIIRQYGGNDPQVTADRQQLMQATTFSIDVTTRPEDFSYFDNSAGAESWIKFENLVINGPGIGYRQLPINEANAWNEKLEPAGSTTRHFTVSLGSIPWGTLTLNPDTGAPDYLQMIIITQSSQNFDGLHYYFDNMKAEQIGSVLAWNVDANGNWSNGANWNPTPGGPNDSSSTANFFGAISASRTVTVNAARTVANMNFNNANAYTIGGNSMLTLAAAAGAAGLDVSGGSHVISAPITLGSNLNISIAGGSTLTISSNTFNGGSFSILKQGGGVVEFKQLRCGALTTVSNGVVITAGATANSTASTVVCTSIGISGNLPYLDLNNNSMIVDYTGGSPITAIKNYILQGYNAGNGWAPTGITSTAANTPIASGPLAGKTAYLGFGDNATLGKTTFNGITVDSTSVLIRWTIQGDATLDGQVDVSDLGALATNWQTSANWSGGDFNYDGFVDVSDLGALATNWQLGVGNPLGPGSLDAALAAVGLGRVSVPEPSSAALFGLAASAALTSRRRGRSKDAQVASIA